MSSSMLASCDFLGRSIIFRPGDDIFDVSSLLDRSDKHVIVGLNYEDRTEKIPGNPKDYEFEAKAELSVNYAGVSVSGSASYSQTSSFKSDSIYGLWSLDQKTHSIFLDGDQTSTISEDFRRAYKSFLGHWGTHYIKECYLGTRYLLRIVKKSESSDTKESMTANIEAEYGSIVKAKGEVKSTEASSNRKDGATDAIVNVRLEEFGTLLKNKTARMNPISVWVNSCRMLSVPSIRCQGLGFDAIIDTASVHHDIWFNVSGPRISIEPASRQGCTLHELTTSSYVANFALNSSNIVSTLVGGADALIEEATKFAGLNDTLERYHPLGLPMSVRLKISGLASAGPVRFYFKTGCGEVTLRGSSQSSSSTIKMPDGRSFVEGVVVLPKLLATGDYEVV
ncbi:hypothetical protein ALT_0278 [Aspergillus lentulus]|uniref:MACPF domain-containing protein n=1 Tax=Aspergillus lentulus TaxID=293939 RepID=A0AAN4T6N6_ASPLE|nr:hypothetical protein ALT_0278 [Aspergillus lentulus]